VTGSPVKGWFPGSFSQLPWSPARSRRQGGAPAAQRGRTTLTPVRTGAGWAARTRVS